MNMAHDPHRRTVADIDWSLKRASDRIKAYRNSPKGTRDLEIHLSVVDRLLDERFTLRNRPNMVEPVPAPTGSSPEDPNKTLQKV